MIEQKSLRKEFRLDEFQGPQVVEVDDADYFLRSVDYNYGCDFFLFHQVQGFASEEFGVDGLRVVDHAVSGGHGESCATVLFHQAAKVSIGEDTCKFAIGRGDGGHA